MLEIYLVFNIQVDPRYNSPMLSLLKKVLDQIIKIYTISFLSIFNIYYYIIILKLIKYCNFNENTSSSILVVLKIKNKVCSATS